MNHLTSFTLALSSCQTISETIYYFYHPVRSIQRQFITLSACQITSQVTFVITRDISYVVISDHLAGDILFISSYQIISQVIYCISLTIMANHLPDDTLALQWLHMYHHANLQYLTGDISTLLSCQTIFLGYLSSIIIANHLPDDTGSKYHHVNLRVSHR